MPEGITIQTSITDLEAQALEHLATDRDVLEIGGGYGYSALVMSRTAASIISVDPHAGELPSSFEQMRTNIDLFPAGCPIKMVRQPSQDALPTMLEAGVRFDLVFIDGDHERAVRVDVPISLLLLRDGGWLCVHDYGDFPAITDTCNSIVRSPPGLVDTLWMGCVDDFA